jgi:site-specific recombinase XerD
LRAPVPLRLQCAIYTPSFLISLKNEGIYMESFDVHKINRRLEQALEILERSEISKKNKEIILEFRDYAFSSGLTKTRILKYVNTLRKLAEWLIISFSEAKKEDIMRLVRQIEQKEYSDWTKHDYKVILKKFYKWLNGDEEYPEKVRWMKTTFKKINQKLPEDLLTSEDVEKMINAAGNLRDKALISLLYESGCRISEILTMRIKHATFDEYGAKILVNGKTGMRQIRVISSVPYLASWLDIHPLRDNHDAPVWIAIGTRNRNEIITYQNARMMLASLAKKIGLKKKANPHIFRHSRATYLANHFTEAQMNQYFGWKQGSDMPSTYVHMSGRDIDGAVLKLHGFKKDEKEDSAEFSPRKCHQCEKTNPPNSKFCVRCGAPLDLETVMKVEEKRKEADNTMTSLMNSLLKDPEMRTIVMGRLREIRVASAS